MTDLKIPVFRRLKRWPVPKQDRRGRIADADIVAMRRLHQEGKTPKQIGLAFPQVALSYIYVVLHGAARRTVDDEK